MVLVWDEPLNGLSGIHILRGSLLEAAPAVCVADNLIVAHPPTPWWLRATPVIVFLFLFFSLSISVPPFAFPPLISVFFHSETDENDVQRCPVC